ncbi:MAG TPA: hypothetical protein VK858_10860 [Longimicrobiales bacterium]|nr:hypothetical protein [Longimicrobiales bacterium]
MGQTIIFRPALVVAAACGLMVSGCGGSAGTEGSASVLTGEPGPVLVDAAAAEPADRPVATLTDSVLPGEASAQEGALASGGDPALRASRLRDRCRAALEDAVARRGDGAVTGWRGDGAFEDEADGAYRILRGEMLVRPRGGPEVVRHYVCTFLPEDQDRLDRAEYGPEPRPEVTELLPELLGQQCRAAVEVLLDRREGARLESWRAPDEVVTADSGRTEVRGEMIVLTARGRKTTYDYRCSFRHENGYRLVDARYGPG